MDLRQVRADLGTVAASAGFNAWSYQPDDPQDLPAAVIGGVKSLTRLNEIVTQIELGVTFYASSADPQDATACLDLALSTGVDGSFIKALDDVSLGSTAWRSCRVATAGPYVQYAMPGGSYSLGVEVVLELTA